MDQIKVCLSEASRRSVISELSTASFNINIWDSEQERLLITAVQSVIKEHILWLLYLCASSGSEDVIHDNEQASFSKIHRISASSSYASTFDEVMYLAAEDRDERGKCTILILRLNIVCRQFANGIFLNELLLNRSVDEW